jgi:hypothetical protein
MLLFDKASDLADDDCFEDDEGLAGGSSPPLELLRLIPPEALPDPEFGTCGRGL